MSILPKEYKVPEKTNYMKLAVGKNKFRILCAPIVGWENWVTTPEGGRKPVRIHLDESFKAEDYDDQNPPKHFWAMIVWNYAEKALQILEFTQKGIIKSLTALDRSEEWGDITDYDIIVNKAGSGMETEYTVNPAPKTELDPEIKKAYENSKINLNALYDGDDPFSMSKEERAEAFDKAIEEIDAHIK